MILEALDRRLCTTVAAYHRAVATTLTTIIDVYLPRNSNAKVKSADLTADQRCSLVGMICC